MAQLASTGTEGFAGISEAVVSLSKAATSDGFTISDEGGQRLVQAMETLQSKVDEHLMKTMLLSQEPPLGTSPGANTYKPFLATVASDPVQGAVPVLKKLKQDLASAADAIRNSTASSRETDQTNGQVLNRAAPGTGYAV